MSLAPSSTAEEAVFPGVAFERCLTRCQLAAAPEQRDPAHVFFY